MAGQCPAIKIVGLKINIFSIDYILLTDAVRILLFVNKSPGKLLP